MKLYDFENSPVTRQQIDGIVGLQTRHVTRRIGQSFCRGIETSVTFDEEKFVGSALSVRVRAGALPGTVCLGQFHFPG
jgi:type VI secretion system protein ImpG